MTFGATLLLAIGLAMDATAVSAAKGLSTPRILPRQVALVAVFFGGFQALMPMVGWLAGARIGPFVESWAHWIAFVLLGVIGTKMLWEAREAPRRADESENTGQDKGDPFGFRVMCVLAVATSIDALAVGVSLPLLHAPFVRTLATIGVTTAVLSGVGLFAGRRFGAMLGNRLDAFGGLVLLGLGVKLLVQGLWR